MRAIVTRPEREALQWVASLQAQGIDALALPLIAITPPADAQALEQANALGEGVAAQLRAGGATG